MSRSAKEILFALPVSGFAVCCGIWIAQGETLLPAAAGGALLCVIVARVSPIGFNALVPGLLVAGYIIGNRGFAQLTVSGSLPLFPAETGMAATLSVLVWTCARERRLPLRRDGLNLALLLWMALSTVRLPFDARTHGVMALRDFAMVYYALFFFVAQQAMQEPAHRRWLRRCLLGSTLALLPLYGAFLLRRDFFLETLTVRGLPLVWFKGDLAGTFMSLGALSWFLEYERDRRRWWAVPAALALAAGMVATENRAAMLALAAGTAWLAAAGRWRFAGWLAASGAAAALAILLWAQAANRPWTRTPLHGVYQRVVSVADWQGRGSYTAEGAESKGDNNRFRAVWWTTVVNETLAGDPWTGLGYGHDLAENFLRAYYADTNEEFTTRSPHNLLISIFARTGAAGLAAFLLVAACMARRTWSAARSGAGTRDGAALADGLGPWCCAWAILASACFGVVLEGPMGAVVFWILLGTAAAWRPEPGAGGGEGGGGASGLSH
ncbi:MAG: O-antigen ligase family protein [Opitutaceae bacterium]|nr:O-antigen ligase family protein [Opitutaceae bacterium]